MRKLGKKLDKIITLRLDEMDFIKLERIFTNRPIEYQDKHRNLSEFIRWILLNFVALQRNVEYRQRENYYTNGIIK
jgi:hypothetical protein